MSPMRFSDLNPEQVLAMTSLTIQEFRELVPPFEEAFERYSKKSIKDLVVEICCALHNLRIRRRHWKPLVESRRCLIKIMMSCSRFSIK